MKASGLAAMAVVLAIAASPVPALAAPAAGPAGQLKPSSRIDIAATTDQAAVCTLGFVFTGRDGMAEALTAAHCGAIGTKVTTERGIAVGTIVDHGASGADIARIDISTELTVYADVADIGEVSDTISVAALNEQRPLLCKKGVSSGLTCGPLVGTATAGYFEFAAASKEGDSGSPVYALTRKGDLLAAGILEGSPVGQPNVAVAAPVEPFIKAWKMSVAR